jgi:hypothetical protein
MKLKLLTGFLLSSFSALLLADSFKCDTADVNVAYGKKSPWGWESVELQVKNGSETINKKYEFVHFYIACKTNTANKQYVVYQAYCSGSACKDYDNWGIINPSPLKVEIEPSDNNHANAEKIFGNTLAPMQSP